MPTSEVPGVDTVVTAAPDDASIESPAEDDQPSAAVDYAARRAARRDERKEARKLSLSKFGSAASDADSGSRVMRRRAFVALISLGVVLVAGALALAIDYGINAGRVHRGVSVMQFDIGGLTPDLAKKQLESRLASTIDNEVAVVYGDSSWTATGAQLGLTFDIDAMISESYSVGRNGSLVSQIAERYKALTSGITVPIGTALNEEAAGAFTASIAQGIDSAPVDSSVAWTDGAFVVTEGSDGRALEADKLVAELPLELVRNSKRYEAPVAVVPMGVSKQSAQEAADRAATLCSKPLDVRYNDKSWTISVGEVSRLFTFIREDQLPEGSVGVTMQSPEGGQALIPVVDPAKVSQVILGKVGAEVGTAPISATFKTENGSVTIVPSKNGIGADPIRLSADILSVLESGADPRSVTIVTTTVEPEVTTEEAKAMGIVERISTYTTTFSSGNAPRVNNIKVLAKALNGTLVAPGGQFSFNGTVGERTADKGYQEAGAIVNGELVNQLGGGICQVNTTLFNAVLLSGLPIDQRRNHSYYIDHYPLGRDATVSWGGPDFKFTNNLDTWVFVSTSSTNGSVTISLYGTSPNYDVQLSTGPWTNVLPHPVKEVQDANLTVGQKIVETHGIDGGTVVLTRIVSKAGKQVRSDTFTSKYTTVTEVVRVGTKPPAPAVTPTVPAPTP